MSIKKMSITKNGIYMSYSSSLQLSRDDQIIIQLCLASNILTEQQIESVLKKYPSRGFIFAATEAGLVGATMIGNLMEQKKHACICPNCKKLVRLSGDEAIAFCQYCNHILDQSVKSTAKVSVEMFGKYQIQERIGRGSFATVYKARHVDLGRLAAIKVLDSNSDVTTLQRFQREARSIASMNHSNIIQIYDIGEEFGRLYIAMEYVDGGTLSKILKTASLSLEQKIKIAIQIADGLQHAHEHNIIHRDIKPDNILMTHDGVVKIADFGLVRPFNYTEPALTQANIALGTPLYMSPEQITSHNITPSSDIYSLGVVLYEMLTGQLPFHQTEQSILLHNILSIAIVTSLALILRIQLYK